MFCAAPDPFRGVSRSPMQDQTEAESGSRDGSLVTPALGEWVSGRLLAPKFMPEEQTEEHKKDDIPISNGAIFHLDCFGCCKTARIRWIHTCVVAWRG